MHAGKRTYLKDLQAAASGARHQQRVTDALQGHRAWLHK
jgi:hypothetical protein